MAFDRSTRNPILVQDELVVWLQSNVRRHETSPSDESIDALAEEAAQAIRRCFEHSPRLRPSKVKRELTALAKHLGNAARSAATAGDQGLSMMAIASGADQEPDQPGMMALILHLERLARVSERAAELASGHARSMLDDHGRRSPDINLRDLIVHLMVCYQEYLGIIPSHTIDPDTGLAPGGVAGFIKEALRLHAPDGLTFEPRLIDEIVRANLSVRHLALFEPPPLPSGPDDQKRAPRRFIQRR